MKIAYAGMVFVLIASSGCTSLKRSPEPPSTGNPAWLHERLAQEPIAGQGNSNAKPETVLPEERSLRSDLQYDMLAESGASTLDVLASWAEPFSPEAYRTEVAKEASRLMTLTGRSIDPNTQAVGVTIPVHLRPSRIELLYNQQGLAADKKLRQFGYDMFTSSDTDAVSLAVSGSEAQPSQYLQQMTGPWRQISESETFKNLLSSIRPGPVDPSYVIGPGDEIIVNTSGAIELSETLVVDRNGILFIPKVGSVRLVGVAASELENHIKAAFAKQFSNTELEATLGRLQSVRLLVIGHVTRPGLQIVPANATLIEVLTGAGGPTKDGSLRHVVIQRQGGVTLEVDLYDLYRAQPANPDAVVLAGDIVHVGPIGQTAALMSPSGQGIYEFKPGETLQDLLTYAGNLNSFTRMASVRLERTVRQQEREVVVLDQDRMLDYRLQDGDIVLLSEVSRRISNTVTLSGAVIHPAEYPHHEGMYVSDLLQLGGGFLVDAHLDHAVLRRRIGQEGAFDIIPQDQRGRIRQETIWIDLAAILAGDTQADRMLQRLDVLQILTRNDMQDTPSVSIMGAVRKPGAYDLSVGLTLKDLIRLAGNPTGEAFTGQSTLVRRVMRPDKRQFDVQLLHFNLTEVLQEGNASRMQLQNGDQVIVRRVQSLQIKVEIEGRVQFPGTYILPDGATLFDLLIAAGGLLPDADLRAAVFTRTRIRELQERHLSRNLARTEERYARTRDKVTRDGHLPEAVANDLSLLGLGRINRNMLRYQALGRVVIDLTQEAFPDSTDNLVLETGDRLVIPRLTQTVMVMGRVFNPNAFVWKGRMTVGEYLDQAGGFEEDADKTHVYVITASGLVQSMSQSRRLRLHRDYEPGPGDTIIVPSKPLGRSMLRMLGDQIALARSAAELGLVGASTDVVLDSSSASIGMGMGLGSGAPPASENSGRPYEEMLMREKAVGNQQ